MSNSSHATLVVLTTSLIAFLGGCREVVRPVQPPPDPAIHFWIGTTGVILVPGESFSMLANAVRDSVGLIVFDLDSVQWRSAEPKVVKMAGSRDRITAMGLGLAHIYASYAGHTDSASVLVRYRPFPTRSYTAVAVGPVTTCALDPDGRAYCWGSDFQGALGSDPVRNFTDVVTPQLVSGNERYASIVTGNQFACGLTSSGTAYCWGWDHRGQLGDGRDHTDFSGTGLVLGRGTPEPVEGSHRFSVLSLGSQHACALDQDGVAYCWGDNGFGELGTDSWSLDVPTPTPVVGGHTFVGLAAGGFHTCGLTADGTAYCWGLDDRGQLGAPATGLCLGGLPCSPSPIAVVGSVRFDTLVSGRCGLSVAHRLYCWGGADDSATAVSMPAGTPAFVSIMGGADSTCGLTADGTAYCWGSDEWGQLGDGGPVNSVGDSTLVRVAGGLHFRMLSGDIHVCGITTDDALYCWGYNGHGVLGRGTNELGEPNASSTPLEVVDFGGA